MTLFVVSLASNFLANDRPILAWYKGELLFPVFVTYPEEKFGGFLAPHGLSRSDDREGDQTRMAGCSGRRFAIPTTRIISICRRPRPRRRHGC